MKKLTRTLAMVLALVMAMTVFAGCGSSEPAATEAPQAAATEAPKAEGATQAPVSDDPYFVAGEAKNFHFAAAGPAHWGDFNGNPFMQKMEEKTMVHVDWTMFPMEVAAERVGVLMASSPRPDAFWGHNNFGRLQADQYGKQGLLIDLKPLIKEHAPHISAALDEMDGWRALDAGDGCIYSLPRVPYTPKDSSTVFTHMIMNGELLKEVGMEVPTTTDELYEVLKAFKGLKTADGKEIIPFSYGPMYNYGDMLRGAFGLIDSTCGPSIMDGLYLMYDGEKVTPLANQENYKEFIKYMNKLSTEGLIDPEVYTQDNNTFNAKGQADQLGCFIDWNGVGVVGGVQKMHGNPYVGVPALKGPSGEALTQYRIEPVRNAADFCITVDCKDPVSLIKFIDILYNPELDVAFEAEYGTRDINWKEVEPGIVEKIETPKEFPSYSAFLFSQTVSSGPYYLGDRLNLHMKNSEPQDWKVELSTMGYNDAAKYPTLPLLSFTDEETEQLSILRTDLMDYIKGFEAACITGQKDVDAEWEGHLKRLEKLGINDLVEIYTNALARYNAKG